jgi:hypothetical protein
MCFLSKQNRAHGSWCGLMFCFLLLGTFHGLTTLWGQSAEVDPFADDSTSNPNQVSPVDPPTTHIKADKPTMQSMKIMLHREAAANETEIDKAQAKIKQKLLTKIDLACPEAELGRIVEALGEKLEITILFDPIGIEEAGVTRDQILSHQLRGITAKSALKIILEPLNLQTIFENEALVITSKEKACARLHTHVYACRDLLELIPKTYVRNQLFGSFSRGGGGFGTGAAPDNAVSPAESPEQTPPESKTSVPTTPLEKIYDADRLADLVMGTIEPDSWLDNGGKGSIESFGDMLIVSQTEDVHEQIEKLLAAMREVAKKP